MSKNRNLVVLLSAALCALCAGAAEYTWTGNGTILVLGDGSGMAVIFR